MIWKGSIDVVAKVSFSRFSLEKHLLDTRNYRQAVVNVHGYLRFHLCWCGRRLGKGINSSSSGREDCVEGECRLSTLWTKFGLFSCRRPSSATICKCRVFRRRTGCRLSTCTTLNTYTRVFLWPFRRGRKTFHSTGSHCWSDSISVASRAYCQTVGLFYVSYDTGNRLWPFDRMPEEWKKKIDSRYAPGSWAW